MGRHRRPRASEQASFAVVLPMVLDRLTKYNIYLEVALLDRFHDSALAFREVLAP